MDPIEDPRLPLANERTDLAYVRSRWAAERTLMAWIRTCLSMVSFGFAIDRFMAYMHHQHPHSTILGRPDLLGLALVSVGVLFMVFAIAEHTFTLRRLAKQRTSVSSRLSLPLFGAITVLLIGVIALLLIVFHRPWSG